MTTDPLSLRNLLLGGADAPSSEGEDEAALVEVRQEIQSKMPTLSWADASKEIDEKVDLILNQPLDKMLVKAWAKYKDLQKYTDPKVYRTGKTVFTSLAKHKLDASFVPSVVIQVAGVDFAQLELPILLSLDLEGIVLKIDGGKILAVQAGSLQGVGSIQFRLNVLRPPLPARDLFQKIEKKTDKFDFPAAISFGEGITIHRPDAEDRHDISR